jgi:hypothetical protein
VAEEEKSLDQLMQLAMSVYYNQDIIKRREKDKKHHDLIAALREDPTRLGPTSRTCYQCGQKGYYHRECPKVGQPKIWPHTLLGPCPLCKGSHWRSKCPISRWKAGCYILWINGFQGLLSRLHFLTSILRSLR